MRTIVVTSQKGGSGKTTLALSLAVEIERAGDGPAWLIDTDPQATLSRWHDRRELEHPQRAAVPFDQLAAGLRALEQRGAAYTIIDTPPTITEQSAQLIQLADLVLIPVRPSGADLWAVGETVALVKAAGKPFLFAVCQAKAQARLTAQAVAALSAHGRVAPTFVGDRIPHAEAIGSGYTASEIQPKGPAAEEIRGLWQDVRTCFPSSNAITQHRSKAILEG